MSAARGAVVEREPQKVVRESPLDPLRARCPGYDPCPAEVDSGRSIGLCILHMHTTRQVVLSEYQPGDWTGEAG